MIWTNERNLPAPLVSAIRNDPYKAVGDISVTALLKPPKVRALEFVHKEEITEDVSDHVWRLLGQSVHAILERADTSNHLAEERLSADVMGWTVSGQVDLLDSEGVLTDYKVTSVWSFLLGDKPDWEAQANIYRWLYKKAGFDVKKLQIVAILRDWTSSRADDEGYPNCAIHVVDIPIWDDAKVLKFVEERVALHQAALRSVAGVNCSDEERWARPDTWAVKKAGAKRAKRVFKNPQEAQQMAAAEKLEVEHRPGENVRCERFCVVSRWCAQFQAMKVAA